ncbi:double-stranded RNA-specific adenosine deaminase-like [Ylistrum balloti]|uniref:double-stranded RNA-specific adenosine deaminase-like n=1 Tax=Ylistrum balloti TaxID=509963 RepID=UPI002905CE0F|nr:double-stranded RNA-specific adenosine deaminase-like [Ylistrum balloti]
MTEEWRESLDNMNKNCISRLQEYAVKRKYEVRYEETITGDGGFQYDVYFEKFVASGTGSRKREAKEAAADRALRSLYSNSGNNQSEANHQSDETSTYMYIRDGMICSDKEENGSESESSTYAVSRELSKYTPSRSNVNLPSWGQIEQTSPTNCISSVSTGKNPISAFMEYAQAKGEIGSFEEEAKWGPSHCPTFKIRALLGKRKLAEGTAGNKKDAKKRAAEASINMLSTSSPSNALVYRDSVPTLSRLLDDQNTSIYPAGADPISVLNEYAQKRDLELTFPDQDVSGADHERTFTLRAMIGNMDFPWASGSTIKEAKREASRKALKQLKQNGLYYYQSGMSTFTISQPLTFQDRMAKLCHEKFDRVVADISENLAGRKVIAGIVMESTTSKTFDVISIASGNRFIKGDALTTEGQVLVDSHAEILASRGMRRFLYNHLAKLSRGEKSYVLRRHGAGKAEVVPDIKFHLYISTAPCGDGAIFTHSTGQSNDEPGSLNVKDHNPTFADNKQGQLRTKIEQGEGQIPTNKMHVSHQYQAMDAVRGGERLLVMSCSDKICKWNMLGMQGALLASLMKPVYFSSITLGTLYNHGHMARAMCCRLDNNVLMMHDILSDGYKVNHPLLGAVSRKEDPRRSVDKSTSYSINWNTADDSTEMTDGPTGLQHSGGYSRSTSRSRLCKQQFLQLYKQICTDVGFPHLVKDDYLATKRASTIYQSGKKAMYAILHSKGYGTWVGLPRECQEFSTTSTPTVHRIVGLLH